MTSDDLKHKALKKLQLLQALGDEIRLKIHLGGTEAKDEWARIEPALANAEKLAVDVDDDAHALFDEFVEKMKSLSASLD